MTGRDALPVQPKRRRQTLARSSKSTSSLVLASRSFNWQRPASHSSGPTMMALADATMYAVVLSAIGIVKLAVTISFNINFLHRPPPADLMADGRLLKLGKRLAVIEVTLHSDGHKEPVAHATGTYSIPPERT